MRRHVRNLDSGGQSSLLLVVVLRSRVLREMRSSAAAFAAPSSLCFGFMPDKQTRNTSIATD